MRWRRVVQSKDELEGTCRLGAALFRHTSQSGSVQADPRLLLRQRRKAVHHQVDVDALPPAPHLLDHAPHLRTGVSQPATTTQPHTHARMNAKGGGGIAPVSACFTDVRHHPGPPAPSAARHSCSGMQHHTAAARSSSEHPLTSPRLKPIWAISSTTCSRGTLWVRADTCCQAPHQQARRNRIQREGVRWGSNRRTRKG